MSADELTKHDRVLMGMVMSLQMAAMQQLGKITNPLSGEVERDLDAARATIDMLEMLKVKCRTGTPADLLRTLDTLVMELQMNYVDEVKKDRDQPPAAAASPDVPEPPAASEGEAPA